MKNLRFRFFISGVEKELLPGSELWELSLAGKESTTGDYFKAAAAFLSKQDCVPLTKALESFFQFPVPKSYIPKSYIKDVSIFLEKHGAFYHPMKVQVELNNSDSCYFVLNGAVSSHGLALIETEYQLISSLNSLFLKQYLPQVYAMDFVEGPKTQTGFFLGEWFGGYKEFHITNDRGKREIALWEGDGTCQYIPEAQALPIYKEVSRILTYYYNIETFEQISPWHHAAGDFIAKKETDGFTVRLVTVRGYQPLTEFCPNEKQDEKRKKAHILPSLLIFFTKLSLKIRIDRLNGQGEYCFLSDKIIGATVDGFLETLDEKSENYNYGDLKNIFIGFFKQFDTEQLMSMVNNIADSEEFNETEKQLLIKNSNAHCMILHSIFQNL